MASEKDYERAKELIGEMGSTWADMLSGLLDKYTQGVTSGNTGLLLDFVFHSAAFIYALRDLPEEGDILAIADRMARILTTDGEKTIGVDLQLMSHEELAAKVRMEMMTQALGELDGKNMIKH